MKFTTLVSVNDVAQFSAPHVIVDCRSQLANTEWGEQEYRQLHIAGARYAHLERDLSGPIVRGQTGRHPLPSAAQLCDVFSRLGIGRDCQVFAYDQDNGAYSARLWWLLRWLGHDAVAVIDGGWRAWQQAGLATSNVVPTVTAQLFVGVTQADKVVDANDVLHRDEHCIAIDARGANRFAGRDETIDPVAGHIPAARSFPFTENVDQNAQFLSHDDLRARFAALKDKQVISYCGSGVTACHNILAMVHSGLPEPHLYAGSWSEWICDPKRPIATGSD